MNETYIITIKSRKDVTKIEMHQGLAFVANMLDMNKSYPRQCLLTVNRKTKRVKLSEIEDSQITK